MSQKLENYIWFEKYRPKTLDDLILDDKSRSQFEKFIADKNIPHLLFSGQPGTGKTTVSEILIRSLDPKNIATLRLNASSDRGIDIVREKIYPFIMSKNSNKLKIVFLDEFDNTTRDFQTSLRNYMEQYSLTSRFILTCNYKNRIIDPLISRCTVFDFKEMPKKAVLKYVMDILGNENISYKLPDIKSVITEYYPDIRTIVNVIQSSCDNGEFIYDDTVARSNIYKQIVAFIKFGGYKELGIYVNKNRVEFLDFYKAMFDKAEDYFGEDRAIPVRVILFNAMKDHTVVPDPFVNFLYYSIELMKACGIKEKGIK